MAYEGSLRTVPGLAASGDLSSDQFKFMVIGSTGAALNTAEGVLCDGVLQNKPNAAGLEAEVAFSGVSKVMAGDAISAGALVMSSTAGKAITATTGKAIQGRALEEATADGDIISVLLDSRSVAP